MEIVNKVTDYKFMQNALDMLGIKHEDGPIETHKLIVIRSRVDEVIMFVFDENGGYKYMG